MFHYGRIILLCACFISFFYTKGTPSPTDSLRHALDTAKTAGTKVMLRYYIAVAENIHDTAFWRNMIVTARQAGNTDIEIASLDRMGFFLTTMGDLKTAALYLDSAIHAAAGSGIPNSQFAPLYHITDVYLLQGDIKTAINYGFRTLKYAELSKDTMNIGISCSMLGKIYSRIGYPQKALKWHLQGLRLAGSLRPDITAVLICYTGMDYCEIGDTVKALPYFYKCKAYIDSIDASALQAALYNAVGMAHDINHHPAEAARYYHISYDVAAGIDNKIAQASSLLLLASNAFKMNDVKNAKVYAHKSLQLARATDNKIQLPRIALLLKNIYQKEHDYREALLYNDLYILYRDSLTSENIQQQAMEQEYHDEIARKENNNRLLAKQNKIQVLELKQRNYMVAGLLSGIVLLTMIFLMLARQRAIRTEQVKIRIEQQLLRTQMNPHFIFNALQAIQNMVLNADQKQAVKYLSSFANLTREVLQNSREDMIPLSKELLLVEHYLQLQKLRFNNRFEYQVLQGAEIDDNMLIPPMLGQPFIENAVEHGMRKIGSGGLVQVSYEIDGAYLRVQIIDNGYGMDAGNRNTKQHQSMAIAITRERIEIMNKKQRLKTSFELGEAFPAEKERKGVRVIFLLPIITIA